MAKNLKTFEARELWTIGGKDGEIGCGSFATVRFCKNLSLERFAVKCFKISSNENTTNDIAKKSMNEAKVLLKATHLHIMKIYGVVKWANYIGVVSEYLPGGNLDGFLRNKNLLDIPWPLRLRMALQLSEAITYLHNYKPKKALIHGDVKPENVLLTKNLLVKLSDFGAVNLVTNLGASNTTTNLPKSHQHTPYYTAPEYLKDIHKESCPQKDVFSFGIVLYEFITRVRPYENVQRHQSVILQVIVDLEQRPDQSHFVEIQRGLSPDDANIFDLLVEQMRKCWSQKSSDRPEMKIVWNSFHSAFHELNNDFISQQIRDVVQTIGRKEMDFDLAQGVPLHLALSNFHNLTESGESSVPSDATNSGSNRRATLNTDTPSASVLPDHASYNPILDTGSELSITIQMRDNLIDRMKRKPNGRDLIEICCDAMNLADDDVTSELAFHFPTKASFFECTLSSNDTHALSLVLRKVNKRVKYLNFGSCNLKSVSFGFIVNAFKRMEGSVDKLCIYRNHLSSDDINGICVVIDKVNKELIMWLCFDDESGWLPYRHANTSERSHIQNKLSSLDNLNLKVDVDVVGASLQKNPPTKNCEIC